MFTKETLAPILPIDVVVTGKVVAITHFCVFVDIGVASVLGRLDFVGVGSADIPRLEKLTQGDIVEARVVAYCYSSDFINGENTEENRIIKQVWLKLTAL